jgi:hypothetical protein
VPGRPSAKTLAPRPPARDRGRTFAALRGHRSLRNALVPDRHPNASVAPARPGPEQPSRSGRLVVSTDARHPAPPSIRG